MPTISSATKQSSGKYKVRVTADSKGGKGDLVVVSGGARAKVGTWSAPENRKAGGGIAATGLGVKIIATEGTAESQPFTIIAVGEAE